ncbi:MAG: penicillin acylase family protein, partial [Acidimicrobiia bacterium]
MNLTRLLFRALLGKRLPTYEGVLPVDGLEGAVSIGRDLYGIPHIAATTSHDAWFALGFCQGQDRGFQLEAQRRVVRGTLGELLGPEALDVDRLSRRMGLAAASHTTLRRMRSTDRAALSAFAAGVNAATDTGAAARPHELTLLRGPATACTPEDVVGLTLLQAFALASNWDSELARLEILMNDGREALAALDATYPEWHPVTSPPGTEAGPAIDALRRDMDRFAETVQLGAGSNNWALSPERTATGRPLLANDPHLAPVLPPHWYLAHVTTGEWGLAGACLAGTPSFGVGHNGHVAWGVTAGLIDNTDLFVEEIGENGTSVRSGDDYVACPVRTEVIKVKGGPPVIERVVETPRGPIISPALDRTPVAISMSATWLDPERPGMLATVHEARTVEDAHAEMRWWHGPSLNVTLADDTGSIAWKLIGEAPRRVSGHGTLPLAGWAADTGWSEDRVPYEELPGATSPRAGFVATANNRPQREDEEPFLGVDWIDGHRITRIVELLEAEDDWTVDKTLRMQLDTVSPAWTDLRDSVLGVGERGDFVAAYRLLDRWDGDMATTSPAATVFVAWLIEMEHRVASAKAVTTAATVLGKGHAPAALSPYSMFAFRRIGHLTALLRDRPDGWFDDWNAEIAAALAAAEATLRSRFGAATSGWAWGTARPLTLRHGAGEKPPLDKVFNIGPIPWSGGFSTVSQSGAPPLDPFGNPSAIASLRAVMDVGAWDRSRFSLPGGQSGNPVSPHYADQVEAWRNGEGVPMPWSR